MASRKEYVYQIKGKKIALLERDVLSADGLNYSFSGTAGDGLIDGTSSGSSAWKSPISSVTDGLEIEYVYSPDWSTPSNSDYGTNIFGMSGWIVVDGYLTFVRSEATTERTDWSSVVSDGSYILIENSDRWNGIHKVQEGQAKLSTSHAGVKTYTKVHQSASSFSEPVIQAGGTSNKINSLTVTHVNNLLRWEYVWHCGSNAITNVILFSGHEEGPDGNTQLLVNGSWYLFNNVEDIEETITTPNMAYQSSFTGYFYEAFYDPNLLMHTGVDINSVNILNDENDTIDLPLYLSKALVLYVKAKVAEDAMNIEAKEYLMKEFRKMIEKHENGKIWGARQIQPGTGAIR